MRVLMLDFGILSFCSWSMECSCMAPLITPAVMVMSGLIFHPLFCMVLINGSYFYYLDVNEGSNNFTSRIRRSQSTCHFSMSRFTKYVDEKHKDISL
jgi:hypothetical protein